ncbi:unnamed protein product [Caenorhabditis angaria]|uniref:Uncharacterized protein n=1 Tax=Caenorhabditis angaria TaxID=860376 RepID=A0A9P1J6K3_9PELO|nr:unnamed protein product [Caenorhabditis angaria]
MLKFIIFLIALNLISEIQCRKITIYNKCSMTIWPGILGPGNPAGGGFELKSGESRDIDVADSWTAGRIWARTGCDSNFNCETGFCRNSEQCNGAGGVPPVSLAEFTLNGWAGQDFYDVSLVDGYNLPVMILPYGGGLNKKSIFNGGCKRAGGCFKDLNKICPPELAIKGKTGQIVACKSGCLGYNTDQECCRGAFGTADKCHRSRTAQMFKDACPTAYSYAYDDKTSTFTCPKGTNYVVQFC